VDSELEAFFAILAARLAVKKKLRQKLRDPSSSMVFKKYTTRATLNNQLQVQENQMLFEKL
jgi:hypothetical protein